MRFTVDGKPYCDVRIDKTINRLVYPKDEPKMTESSEYAFNGWAYDEGYYLQGIASNSQVICRGSPD